MMRRMHPREKEKIMSFRTILPEPNKRLTKYAVQISSGG